MESVVIKLTIGVKTAEIMGIQNIRVRSKAETLISQQ